jgi:spermidine dehydrogenase
MPTEDDHKLGLDRPVTRRDFLNGVAVTSAAALACPHLAWAAAADPVSRTPAGYPPALTGMRGSGYPRAYQTGHSLRDGNYWPQAPVAIDTSETYDLIVVGGGISGLTAAYLYQKRHGRDKTVLVLDNHDDFGGHAKRNQYTFGETLRLSSAGTFDLAAGRTPVQREVLADLGIDIPALTQKNVNTGFYSSLGMGQGVFFDKETFGADKLMKSPLPWTDFTYMYTPNPPADAEAMWQQFLKDAPLSEAAKKDLYRLYHDRKDYLPHLSYDEKLAKLDTMSYEDFLLRVVDCDPMVCAFLRDKTFGDGRGIGSTPALLAHTRFGLPGFDGMALELEPVAEEAVYHFPDGNATVARLLVRKLIPAALPGHTMEDSILAHVDYAALDRTGQSCRIRLSSTAVKAVNLTIGGKTRGVEVEYSRDGILYKTTAAHCVMACWNFVIPYLCPEMPAEQKEALAYNVHTPNLWLNVWLRNWKPFHKAGINFINAPNGYYSQIILEHPITVGGYKHSQSPDEPIVLSMLRGYVRPGLDIKEQFRLGRMEMYNTTFEEFEREARSQLGRALGPYGFDPAEDIVGITVNRWGHGYSYWYSALYDEFLKTGGEPPHLRARVPFGNITIANTDAAGICGTGLAIDMAARAVDELTFS